LEKDENSITERFPAAVTEEKKIDARVVPISLFADYTDTEWDR